MENNKINWWKICVIAFLIALSFFLGRKSVKLPTEQPPVYIPADTIRIEVPKPFPVEVKMPADTADIIAECAANGKYWELFPEKVRDSLVYVPTSQDTLDIIRDWAAERFYEKKIYGIDTVGTATIKAKTQYNRLSIISAEVVPVVKTVPYVLPPKKYEPFIGTGLTTASTVMAAGGIFVNGHWGGMVQYQRDFEQKKNVFGGAVVYKF